MGRGPPGRSAAQSDHAPGPDRRGRCAALLGDRQTVPGPRLPIGRHLGGRGPPGLGSPGVAPPQGHLRLPGPGTRREEHPEGRPGAAAELSAGSPALSAALGLATPGCPLCSPRQRETLSLEVLHPPDSAERRLVSRALPGVAEPRA